MFTRLTVCCLVCITGGFEMKVFIFLNTMSIRFREKAY